MTSDIGFWRSPAESPAWLTPSKGSEKPHHIHLKSVFSTGTPESFRQTSGRRETEAAMLLGVTGEQQSAAAEQADWLCRTQQVAVLGQGTVVPAEHSRMNPEIPQTDSPLVLGAQAGSMGKPILFKIQKYSHSYFSSSNVFFYSPWLRMYCLIRFFVEAL